MARKTKPDPVGEARAAMRRAARAANLADLREGRRVRAQTFVDRKREASRTACRGPVRED